MKGEPLQKPPPLLLPGKRNLHERDVHRFRNNKYDDSYNGLIKRVSVLTVEEPSESCSVRTRSSQSSGIGRSESSACDDSCPFDDASSASSCTGSSSVAGSVGDCCPPYEEVPPAREKAEKKCALGSFRDDLPPSTNTRLYYNEPLIRCNSTSLSEYSNANVTRRRPSRSKSLYNNAEQESLEKSLYINYPLDPASPTTLSDKPANDQENSERRLSFDQQVTETEKKKIEMFFRGLRTSLWICGSLANLYSCMSANSGNGVNAENATWKFRHTGVPLVILESGDTRSRSKRRIQIILAERGTCFPLWRDTIDNLSSYRKASRAFHTMHLSSDHAQVVGLSFDSEEEADKLLKQIETLCADPENINISVPKKAKKLLKAKKPMPLPLKKNISRPCLFEHVTTVAARDKSMYMSMQTLVQDQLKQLHHDNIA